MGSLDNFHEAVVQRVRSGELMLGVSNMAGATPGSIAFSRFWTMFPFLAAAASLAVLWLLDVGSYWIYVVLGIAAFFVGVVIRRSKGKQKAWDLAVSDAFAFDRLWSEGALSLKMAIVPPSLVGADTCVSPDGDYRQFMAQNFLHAREYGNRVAKVRVFS